MPFKVSKVYSTKISTFGVRREFEHQAVYIPEAQLSDVKDLEEEDDPEIPHVMNNDFMPNPRAFETLRAEVEDRESYSDEFSEEGDIANESSEGLAKAKRKGAVQKCREHKNKY